METLTTASCCIPISLAFSKPLPPRPRQQYWIRGIVQICLFSNTVNRFFWSETAMGVKFYTDNFYLAWLRGKDQFQNNTSGNQDWRENDLDTLNARDDLKMEPVKV